MVTAKEIRDYIVNQTTLDLRRIAVMTDDELMDAYAKGFGDDGEIIIDEVIHEPKEGTWESYWREISSRLWEFTMEGHPNDGARVQLQTANLLNGDCVYIIDYASSDTDAEYNVFEYVDQALEELAEMKRGLVDIW